MEYEVEIQSLGRRSVTAGDPSTAAASAVRELFSEKLSQARGQLPPLPGAPIRVVVFSNREHLGEFDVTVTIDGWGNQPTVRTDVSSVNSRSPE